MFAINTFKTLITQNLIRDVRLTQVANKFGYGPNRPKLRTPEWFPRKERRVVADQITPENRKFLQSVVEEKYGKPIIKKGVPTYENTSSSSLIKVEEVEQHAWTQGKIRTGLIGKKLGLYPLWLKNGRKIITTMIQIQDCHVIKYTPPEQNDPTQKKHLFKYNKFGMLQIGSGTEDPNNLTANYLSLFKEAGVMPKKHINRFVISPSARLPPGAELSVLHFRVGDFVDVRGNTIDRGFQGVMKRWGFKGQPATHGATKTHRRPGSIGGGLRARVWPGKKMPGHMGNRWRTQKGLKIWRINRKYNTMWVSGRSVAGNPGDLVYVFDSLLPLRRVKNPHFPTFMGDENSIPEDVFDENVHQFGDPTIFFEPEA